MLKFNASAFYHAASTMRAAHASLRAMQKAKDFESDKPVNADTRNSLRHNMKAMDLALKELGAKVSSIAVAKTIGNADDPTFTWDDLERALQGINSRLEDELSLVTMLVLDSERQKYFLTTPPPFGSEVADRIPNAISDIEDAGKCLAISQGTASVFHSMRVMEAALKRLAALLGIPYAPSWESYINQIEAKITARHKTKSVSWKRDEPFYREILGNLQTIKIAWRNPTMHIVRRYTPDEAEEIYIAVRAFVKRLSPRLPAPKKTKADAT